MVTKSLFKKYKTAEDFLAVPVEELEQDVKTCGFYRQKAKSIRATCAKIVENFGGKVPDTLEELTTLDGVGRKTANVVLGECFGVPGVVVDTHCMRITRRLGLTKEVDPTKIEHDLMKVWPKKDWTINSHTTIYHGRAVCIARAPKCSICAVNDLCPFPETREGKRSAK
jgi:endonuclease-3